MLKAIILSTEIIRTKQKTPQIFGKIIGSNVTCQKLARKIVFMLAAGL